MARRLGYDPLRRIVRRFHYDHSDDSFGVETVQDVEDILAANKEDFNAHDERSPWGNATFHRVANVPLTVFWEWHRLGLAMDDKDLLKRLDDPMFSKFRTRPGKLSR